MKQFVHQLATNPRWQRRAFLLLAAGVVLAGLWLGAAGSPRGAAKPSQAGAAQGGAGAEGTQGGTGASGAETSGAGTSGAEGGTGASGAEASGTKGGTGASGAGTSGADSAPSQADADPSPYGPDALAGLLIAVDPGHGGYDGGARCHDSGVWEKEINLQIALQLEQALRAYGADVLLTRREDVALHPADCAPHARKHADLQARRDLAETSGAWILLSVHMNEYRSRAESGPQTFYQRGGDEGRLLAAVLQRQLVEALKPRRVRQPMAGNYYVLRGALPSALVECGFISHADEERLLLDAAYQRRVAEAIARGVCEYRVLTGDGGR